MNTEPNLPEFPDVPPLRLGPAGLEVWGKTFQPPASHVRLLPAPAPDHIEDDTDPDGDHV